MLPNTYWQRIHSALVGGGGDWALPPTLRIQFWGYNFENIILVFGKLLLKPGESVHSKIHFRFKIPFTVSNNWYVCVLVKYSIDKISQGKIVLVFP